MVEVFGQDLNHVMLAVSKAVLLLNYKNTSIVRCGNTLLEDCFYSRKFQYIAGVFPFSYSWKNIEKQIRQEEAFGRFYMGLPSVNDSQFLFIQHMISKMESSGSRIVTLTTGSAVWGGTAGSGENNIRRRIIESDLVEAIISLPAGTLYPITSIPLYLWIFSNKKEENRRNRVQLIDSSSFISQRQRESVVDDNSIKHILSEYENYSNTDCSKIIRNEEFMYFQINLYHSGLKKADERQIPIGDNIDDYIAKEVQPYIKGSVEIDYSSVEKGCAIHFDKFFKKRLSDLSLEKASDRINELSSEIE